MSPKSFIFSLDSLIKTKLEAIRIDEVYLEIFSEFVFDIYREEFFLKVNLSRYQPEITIKKEPFQLPDALLDNPSYFINSGSGDYDKVVALIDFFSKFIETEFKSLKDSTVKNVTLESISQLS